MKRQTKDIWIIIGLIMLVMILGITEQVRSEPLGVRSTFYEQLNSFRAVNGLNKLSIDHSLESVAGEYAKLIQEKNTLSHKLLDNTQFWMLAYDHEVYGYLTIWELLQRGDPAFMNASTILTGYIRSPDHYPPLVSVNGKAMGMAVIQNPNITIVVLYIGIGD